MVLKIYNTLSHKKELFKARDRGKVLFYTCGPTVHDYAHIGNFRTFVVMDVLKRWLEEKGYLVIHVMNVTDVDEKTIERAARKKIPLKELTKGYEKAFFEDIDLLKIKPAENYPRVSENLEPIVDMVKGLHEKGHAFKDSDGSFYYDINTFEKYGRLSGIIPHRKIRAKMPREDYKSPKNFLLWKACSSKTEDGCWNTELGYGRPGWHIECAALAKKYLGETIDIHSGGVDLIFPHHENEIAEAEGITGKTFSRYWMHVEHLLSYGKKMSKSMGNFYTLKEIVKKGWDPMTLRLLYLKTHYRDTMDFSFHRLNDAKKELEELKKLREALKKVNRSGSGSGRVNKEFRKTFSDHMDDDLQTDMAWKAFLDFIEKSKDALKAEELNITDTRRLQRDIDMACRVFGLGGV